MLKLNLRLFFRGIKKQKGVFLINIAGLSAGLASALLIYMWVNDELNMDKFLEKDDQLFTVVINREHKSGDIHNS